MSKINQNVLSSVKLELFQREDLKELSEEDRFFIAMLLEEGLQMYLEILSQTVTLPENASLH